MEKILLTEDDSSLGNSLSVHLKSEGFDVIWVQNLQDTTQALNDNKINLLILDWMLPDGQGIDYLKSLRQTQKSLPVIMLTARAELIDKIVGLESGANDYITKPFEPRELIARIRVQLRDKSQETLSEQSEIISYEKLSIDMTSRMVTCEDVKIDLTKMEFDLLKLLVESPGRVFPREELLNKVWGYENYPTTRTVDTHILQLRQKIPFEFIETMRGIGYRVKVNK